MRAVWSFWSKPYLRTEGRTWGTPRHHLMAWGLSHRLARAHFEETMLVTDSAGKRLLVDRLGLEFDHVSTELDRLENADPGWWALGKLVAYGLQEVPFLHLDTDVFLWKKPEPAVLDAPVFAQCPEVHGTAGEVSPQAIVRLFDRHGLSLPPEWSWSASRDGAFFREENCGILGGNRVDFLRHYATEAVRIATDPVHAAAWTEIVRKDGYNMLVEQFWLSACLEYHRSHPESAFRDVEIRHVFPSMDDAFDPRKAALAGFTHLLGDTKSHPEVADRLDRRLATLDPNFHRRCERVALAN